MIYSAENYKVLSERFNSQTLLGKLVLVKSNPQLFQIESDGYNIRLRLLDNEAMILAIDSYFSFPEFIDFEFISALSSLADLPVKKLK
jgi:hypothetical protein